MPALRIFAAISLFLPIWVAAAATSSVPNSESLRPFVKEWRVVLEGSGAQGMEPGIQGWKLEERAVTLSELDAVEAILLPKLAADLNAVEASALPCDYYRQYATGRSKRYHLLLIRGFHHSHISVDADAWKHAAVDVSDGGSHYWDAIYIVELHQFAKMKAPGSPARTVAFHGVA